MSGLTILVNGKAVREFDIAYYPQNTPWYAQTQIGEIVLYSPPAKNGSKQNASPAHVTANAVAQKVIKNEDKNSKPSMKVEVDSEELPDNTSSDAQPTRKGNAGKYHFSGSHLIRALNITDEQIGKREINPSFQDGFIALSGSLCFEPFVG